MSKDLQIIPEAGWYREDLFHNLADAIDRAVEMAAEFQGEPWLTAKEGVPVQAIGNDQYIVGYDEIFLPTVGEVVKDLTWRPS